MSGLLYAWYGDDFTGSTDVLESLAEGGVEAVLFLAPPTPEQRARFPEVRAIGIAGDSRSRSPEWMDAHLPIPFAALKDLSPAIAHYKTCSTFDSSPVHGSIGRALEIGRRIFSSELVPILVGAPHLGRYLLFGNLFARAGTEVYRIDRHPTMSRHPVTPMREADLRVHLGQQTRLNIGLVDLPALQQGRGHAALAKRREEGAQAVFFDGADETSLAAAGAILHDLTAERTLFAVGSSGVTRALLRAWEGRKENTPPARLSDTTDVSPLLVVSGSCSPATAAQIGWGIANGFAGVRVDIAALGTNPEQERERLVAEAGVVLAEGRDCVIYSALGPLEEEGQPIGDGLGQSLGEVVRALIGRCRLRRVLLAGGDTSSHAIAQLGCYALTWAARLEPGAPLCRAHSDDPDFDGVELVLKGGQIGAADFFRTVRRGRSMDVQA